MFAIKTIGSVLLIVGGQIAAADQLTANELLIRSKIPHRREFPLSEKVKPCEDFHRYVCERAEAAFDLPKDRSRWLFSFSDSGERLLEARKAFFKKLNEGYEPKLARTKNVRRLYRACMNREARVREEREYVGAQIGRINGAADAEALRGLINGRLATPEFAFVRFFEEANQENPKRNDLILMASGLTLPEKNTYKDKKAVADLKALAASFFKAAGLDQADRRATAVVNFESSLAEVYPSPAEMRKLFSADTYMKPIEWRNTYPNIDFQQIIGRAPKRAGVRNLTHSALTQVHKFVSEADPFDVQSVLAFHSLKDVMDDAYPAFFKDYFKFQRQHLGGPAERPSREERCTWAAMGSLGMELDAELIDILFPTINTGEVEAVAEAVRAAIVRGIERNRWLSEGARKEALRKIKTAKLKLVRPGREKDWNFLELIALTDDRPIENQMTIRRAEIGRIFKKIHETRNREEWLMSPLTVNAYYSPGDNTFVLPRGILQFPFFDVEQSRIENLAAMGMVVGHELGHGIDDEGAKYDAKGVLRTWMQPSDVEAFRARGARLIEQFNRVGHDGQLTLGENIGDNVGLQFAMEAALPKGEESDIEDMKRFFVSYGRLWCGKMTPEARAVYLKRTPHAAHEARINEQVKHKDLFHRAFQCKAGDKMFLPPEERVQVW